MNCYKINLTSMQWGVIAMDLGKLKEPEESTQALMLLAMRVLEHSADPELGLPYNVELVDDQG